MNTQTCARCGRETRRLWPVGGGVCDECAASVPIPDWLQRLARRLDTTLPLNDENDDTDDDQPIQHEVR